MPESDGESSYRIKHPTEPHERIATQSELRSCGYRSGTQTQAPRWAHTNDAEQYGRARRALAGVARCRKVSFANSPPRRGENWSDSW